MKATDALLFMNNFNESEKGNILLVDVNGTFNVHAFIRIEDDYWLEVRYYEDNYPSLVVKTMKSKETELAERINEEFDGWFAKKLNIVGVEVDEDNFIMGIDESVNFQEDTDLPEEEGDL